MQYRHISPDIWGYLGGVPNLEFFWKEVAGKRRLIGNPNKPMRVLHRLFGKYIVDGVMSTDDAGYGVRKLPSATGCVPHSNPMLNARKHIKGKYFYITDLKNAYPSVDLERLALIIVFLARFNEYREDISLKFFAEDARREAIRDDPLYKEMLAFLSLNFAGLYGRGLAVGGPLSPDLMNLYCEVYLDSRLRRWCERRDIVYTRYVDDLVFSSESSIT
ncbi:MAG: reverse transcriptase domain-containing protein, partial [Candidatus Zixiibacteriota bacterium]